MSARHRIDELLKHPGITCAGRASSDARRMLATGFVELDSALSGGWPVGALIELLADHCNGAGMRLLIPTLAAATSASESAARWAMLIAPPHIPYAPALANAGINLSRLQVVQCQRREDVLWSAEQALHSRGCVAILVWVDERSNPDERSLRRLQLAAERSGCWLVLCRPLCARRQHSPATLRLECRHLVPHELCVDVFKNRGDRPRLVRLASSRCCADQIT